MCWKWTILALCTGLIEFSPSCLVPKTMWTCIKVILVAQHHRWLLFLSFYFTAGTITSPPRAKNRATVCQIHNNTLGNSYPSEWWWQNKQEDRWWLTSQAAQRKLSLHFNTVIFSLMIRIYSSGHVIGNEMWTSEASGGQGLRRDSQKVSRQHFPLQLCEMELPRFSASRMWRLAWKAVFEEALTRPQALNQMPWEESLDIHTSEERPLPLRAHSVHVDTVFEKCCFI